MVQDIFSKLLVARHSPQNKCFAPDGAVLTLMPREPIPLKGAVSHYFVSVQDFRLKSRYGWVKEMPTFTLDEFLALYHPTPNVTDAIREHVLTMLTAVDRITADQPVAVDYASRGIPPQMEVSVHRVIFHP
jgi:hypothetical protein